MFKVKHKHGDNVLQYRIGSLWITYLKKEHDLTVWWSHWLKIFGGDFMVNNRKK